MRKTIYMFALLLAVLLFASWGSKGHRKISQNLAPNLPAGMAFLQPGWTDFVAAHASDADYRKSQDPDESPRHYIDIDNYPVFVLSGRIPHDYDSVVALYGYTFVTDQGILPWATLRTYDSLKSCFSRGDWNRSALFAADLGHYVGDGHMPLHITADYNGQLSGHYGIHSRYESTMIGKFESQIIYSPVPAKHAGNVRQYIFNYLYENYRYVDSIFLADTYALTTAGNTTSNAYYQALWEYSGPFTIRLMQNASAALADLVYTAWVEAGSPRIYPNAIGEPAEAPHAGILNLFPNPVASGVEVDFTLAAPAQVTVTVVDCMGRTVGAMEEGKMEPGTHSVRFDAGQWEPGIYLCRFRAGSVTDTRRFIVSR